MSIAENLAKVRSRIATAAEQSGRRPEDITLIAVTKTVGTDAILEAVAAGATDIGENYVQDSVAKFEQIGHVAKWHMIGHLQKNKVRQAVPVFDMIQGVDSVELAQEIGKRSLALDKVCSILVEVNISGESSKTGICPQKAIQLCEDVSGIEGVSLQGLMGIAPFVDDQDAIRSSFTNLRRLWEQLPIQHRQWLSMGMTSDFEIAIEEGSNMVRIGTAIFGPRMKKPIS